jgi:hypothetical protein
MMQKEEPDTGEPKKPGSAKYEEYIIKDFERHRVFVSIDVFMERVLHVPDNWKELWGATIKKVKGNKGFKDALQSYTDLCGVSGKEKRLYVPLVNMANAIFDAASSSSNESVKVETPLRYLVNDPKGIRGGVMNELIPDVVAVHEKFLPYLDPGEREQLRLAGSYLTWAHPLQVLEVKPGTGVLVDGAHMPRLKVNGELATIFADRVL